MTPADPIWLIAEILASLGRFYREARARREERKKVEGLLPRKSLMSPRALYLLGMGEPKVEPQQLPDNLYSRVQSSLTEFSRRRDMKRTDRAVATGAFASSDAIRWSIQGREVSVEEESRPLFRAVWSKLEGGWRLYWTQSSGRWWPYVNGSHLSMNSFENCVREVERDPRGVFPAQEDHILRPA